MCKAMLHLSSSALMRYVHIGHQHNPVQLQLPELPDVTEAISKRELLNRNAICAYWHRGRTAAPLTRIASMRGVPSALRMTDVLDIS